MEKIEEKKPKAAMRLEPRFNKWNGITTQMFQYFKDHNLAHLDTNPNNVFFTTDGKLAIIDFGESILPDTEVNLRQAKPTGYLKTGNTMAEYNEWLQ
jgi:thiamine kinase-like enzyme